MGHLELQVPVYNINKGMNEELFSKSPHLRQYSEFIAKLREFTKLYNDYSQAVGEAVSHCIKNGILTEFLKKEGGRVVSILSTYDPEVAKRVYGEELMEDVAAEMLRDGEPIEKIAKWTKLSVDTIKSLLDDSHGVSV